MNHIFRVVFNRSLGVFQAVSEMAKSFFVTSSQSKTNKIKSNPKKTFSLNTLYKSVIVSLLAGASLNAHAAQVTVPVNGNIYTLLAANNFDLLLAGNAVWNTAFAVNSAARAVIAIDGAGHTITVGTGNYLFSPISWANNSISLINAIVTTTPSANAAHLPLFNYTAAVTSNLNLEGSTFTGFQGTGIASTIYSNIIYVNNPSVNNIVNVAGGTKGVIFSNNRGSGDAAGAVSVYGGTLNFTGKVTFDSNWTGNYGGALSLYDAYNRVSFAGPTAFKGNHSVVFGGAVDLWGNNSILTFNGPTTFDGNYVYYVDSQNPLHITDQQARGGAINIGYLTPGGSNFTGVIFNDQVSFTKNYVVTTGSGTANRNALGGALSAYGNGLSYLYKYEFNKAAIFDGNYVYSTNAAGVGNGGAIYYDASGATLTLTSGSSFTNNYAKTLGGAIYLQAGTINLNATDNDILFQGNRHGASFNATTYVPIANSGTPNAIYLGASGALNLSAGAGRAVQFYDPISSINGSTVVVTKTGAGDVIFYGDNGLTSNYDSNIQATTNVQAGYFTLANGVKYGLTTAGAFTASGTGTVRGGNGAQLRAQSITIQSGATLAGTGGIFNVNTPSLSMQNGSQFSGLGTLTASSNINMAGTVTANIGSTNTLNIASNLAGTGALTKTGTGALTLSTANTYTGITTVNGGTLNGGIANAFANSSAVTVNSGGNLLLNGFNQTANNLSGAGNINLGGSVLTANNNAATAFSGVIADSGLGGRLTKTGSAGLTLSGINTYTGGTTISAGSLTITNGQALGSGTVANNSQLLLAFNADSILANQLTGTGSITVSGTAKTSLTANNSSVGGVAVTGGTLELAQNGTFNASGYLASSLATTIIKAQSKLNVTGSFSHLAGSNLRVDISSNTPVITANSASLNGTFTVTGFSAAEPTSASALSSTIFTVIKTVAGITGNFSSVNLAGVASSVDYLTMSSGISSNNLDYNIGFGLSWLAGATTGHGTFTLANISDAFNLDVALANQAASATGWNGQSLTKAGAGTLTLSAANTYSGATTVNAGTLSTGIANAFANSNAVAVNSGATLALNNLNQIANNLSGAGAITLGTAILTASGSNNTLFSGILSGAGGRLNKTGSGSLTLSGNNSYSGGTSISAGRLIATQGTALGSGAISNSSELELAFASNGTVTNAINGSGALIKSGAGTATLNAATSAGNVNVNAGTLALTQNGNFSATNYTTATGATTTLGNISKLNVTNNFTQSANSSLSLALGSNSPVITAGSANLNGALNITGFSANQPTSASALGSTLFTLIHTTGGISGNFSSINFNGAASSVDYLQLSGQKSSDNLDYSVGFGLTWLAGTTNGNGTFTLTNSSDTFNLDLALANQSASATGWNGQSLTKAGAGTLTLSAANTYTGATTVNGGTLSAGIANAFANSSAVTVNSGATLALNGFNQTANNLSGAGNVTLGNALLTASNPGNTIFSGILSGIGGSLSKTGSGSLTLSGNNSHSGGTSISGGRLIATQSAALGSGAISNSSELELAFAGNGAVTNAIGGSGDLIKSGAGTATLSAATSAGDVNVNAGTLALTQSGSFSTDNYTTAAGASTTLAASSQLSVADLFTQGANSSLSLALGSNSPVITADSANIDGTLNITGFSANQPTSASALDSTLFTLIHTTSGINGNFSAVNLNGAASTVDYLRLSGQKSSDNLDYNIGFGLSWLAGSTNGNGTFTLTNLADSFNVDRVLSNQTASATGWNGQSLTKAGNGTLTLSAANTYTGSTLVNGGTLSAGIANAFANSSAVTVNSGATLALNGFNQTANNLSGAGNITLGNALLTASNPGNTIFSGILSGIGGSLSKTGSGSLTLSGNNSYSGGTSISGGRLIATQSAALGSGAISNSGELELAFASNDAVTNAIGGSGDLIKSGAGTATLNAATSAGDVNVNAGTLALTQSGSFSTDNYTTAAGASTTLAATSQLSVTDLFTQGANSSLSLTLGNNAPVISADSADIDGTLNITGFSANQPTSASALDSTLFTLIHTTSGINGDFSSINLNGVASTVDYLRLSAQKSSDNLDYNVGFGLSWLAGATTGNGTFTLSNLADSFDVDRVLGNQTASATGWNGQSLTKAGNGTLTLSAANTYTGATTINGGTLSAGIANAFANSSAVTVNSGATLALNDFNQTANNLSGGGNITLGNALLTASNSGNTIFSGILSGIGGSLSKTGSGNLTLSGNNSYSGGTSIAGGRLIATQSAALGSGAISNSGELELAFAGNNSVTNDISGSGNLIKSGSGTATLSSATSAGDVNVNAGTLALVQSGSFSTDNYTTAAGATTSLGNTSQLSIADTFTQESDSTLSLVLGNNAPAIAADSANLNGALNITGFSANQPGSASALDNTLFTLIHTTSGINGDFSSINLNGAASTVDYLQLAAHKSSDNLDYNVGFGLSWLAGATNGNGTFTLTNVADSFDVDRVLGNQTASATGWNGQSLTKAGNGTLTLSAANTYTGSTLVNGGTLSAGITNAFANSSAVIVNSGATLALNDFNQTANNLSGGGNITLGNALLTTSNTANTLFSGVLSGLGGSLSKTGSGSLTLSGNNSYSGGTSISGGRLIATQSAALGSGAITNNSQLELAFAGNNSVTNAISGSGALIKSGSGTATLSSATSAGDVNVNAGTLALTQNGSFSTANYTTAAGATTTLGDDSQLSVTNAFTQDSGSTLSLALGSNAPVISADSADLSGTLNITGFSASQPDSASALDSTLFTLISTITGINGNFSSITINGAASTVDYLQLTAQKSSDNLDYNVGFGLTWLAGATNGNGTFTLTNAADSFDIDRVLSDQASSATGWNGQSLTKAGNGTLILSAANTYTGTTMVNGGTLSAGIANAYANSSAVTVNSGATLALNDFNQTTNNLSGGGNITLGNALLTVSNLGNTLFSGVISGVGGSLNKTGSGNFTLSGNNSYSGGTSISGGRLIATQSSALGSGAITNNSQLELAFAGNNSVTNAISGSGDLIKSGAGTATLSSATSAGDVNVNAGTLALTQNGSFSTANYTTAAGATTTLSDGSQLSVTDSFTQDSGSTLNLALGNNAPAIAADSAYLNGTLNITGFSANQPGSASALDNTLFTLIHTTTGINGDFSSINLNGAASTVDYLQLSAQKSSDNLDYNVGFGLTWLAGATNGNGTFTLTNAADSFDIDRVLSDQASSATGWNGQSLTKAGDGTLILSAANTYTGATTINGGTLSAGIDDAFANSSAVTVNSDGTLALNGFNQTANNLSGSGSINLDNALLTLTGANNTLFSGIISGVDGSLNKTGSGSLTLSGNNSYSGGTSITEGRLIATQSAALGSGEILNSGELELAFATDQTLSQRISGSGDLIKTGAGILQLTNSTSIIGTVNVNAGGLDLAQAGTFNANSYIIATGASTTLSANSQLNVTTDFVQNAGATLNLALGNNSPAISAIGAVLSGTLNITGFSANQPGSASALASTLFTLIDTSAGITGDFDTINLSGAASSVDYLQVLAQKSSDELSYNVGFSLSWLAGVANGNGTFTLADAANSFDVDLVLANQAASTSGWNGQSLTKAGAGTLTLSAANTYTGATIVNGGTLSAAIANAFANSGQVTVNGGATLALNGFNQTANNLSGAGDIALGSGALTVNNLGDTLFSGIISGTSGSLNKTGSGNLTLSGNNSYSGGTSIADGRLIGTHGGALGTGAITNNGELELAFAEDGVVDNAIGGNGDLFKTGAGTVNLTSSASTTGNVNVTAGTLEFSQNGTFTSSGGYTTASGSTTLLGSSSKLAISDTFTQEAGSNLHLVMGSNDPVIAADSAVLGGTLVVSGYAPDKASLLPLVQYNAISTTSGISGNFDSIDLQNATSPVDYLTAGGRISSDNLNFDIGLALTWLEGATLSHGSFTLTDVGEAFDVDIILADQAASATGWNGRDLTMDGIGELTLSALNTYTGSTTVNGGTLIAGINNTFANSSSVIVNANGTLALNNFSQIANNLSGAGSITLGSAVLTANSNSDTLFEGTISGIGGSLVKTGTESLTLSGSNNYGAGTTISGGKLIATQAGALGGGVITNNSELGLAFDNNSTLNNQILGTGTLEKTGSGVAILTADSSSVGDVNVNEGMLSFAQNGTFAADNLTTADGAITQIGSSSQLELSGELAQTANSSLQVGLGSFEPIIKADSATLNGTLSVSGFSASEPTSASELADTQFKILETTGGITGDFTSIGFGSAATSVDFMSIIGSKSADELSYSVGINLTWLAGSTLSHGSFTLLNAGDSFDMDMALTDQAASDTGWNGQTLTKNGDGMLILSKDNTYSGVTQINSGTLQIGNGGTTGSVVGDIVNQAQLSFDRSDIATYAGDISGNGSLLQQGAGTLILSGTHTYTGGTTIANGTLQIGDGTTNGSITGDIINNAALAFNRGDTISYGGAISGTGALHQQGSGSLVLTGNNDYSGGTFIDSGVLQIGNAGTTGSITGDIDIASTGGLIFNRSNNVSFANVISGNGELVKTNNNHLTLTGDSSAYLGHTSVNAGRLIVNGQLGGSMDVMFGGTLAGSGTVGNTTINAGGIVSPGNSIGTLNVNGDITFNSGSIYNVEADPDSLSSDLIHATGSAILTGGSVVHIGSNGNYRAENIYTIITADLGVNGQFDGVTSDFAFLTPTLSYDANNVMLSLQRNSVSFFDLARTPNQRAAAYGVQVLGAGQLYDAILTIGNGFGVAEHAFDQISGEIHASAKSALLEDSRFVRDAANNRLRTALNQTPTDSGQIALQDDSDLTSWGQVFGSWGSNRSDGNAARLSRDTSGILLGMDKPLNERWHAGAIGGYSSTKFDAKDRHSDGSSDNYHLGLYAGAKWDKLAFRTGVAYSWHDISTQRNPLFQGFSDSLSGDYRGNSQQIFAELGYTEQIGVLQVEPFVNLAHVDLHTRAFNESGGAAAVNGQSDNIQQTFSTLGVRSSTTVKVNNVNVTLRDTIGWRHSLSSETPSSNLAFRGSSSFIVSGVPVGKDTAVIELGAEAEISKAVSVGISYGGQFGSGSRDQSGFATVNVRF